jgi:hypothetical protein
MTNTCKIFLSLICPSCSKLFYQFTLCHCITESWNCSFPLIYVSQDLEHKRRMMIGSGKAYGDLYLLETTLSSSMGNLCTVDTMTMHVLDVLCRRPTPKKIKKKIPRITVACQGCGETTSKN